MAGGMTSRTTTYPSIPNSRSSGSDSFHIGPLLPSAYNGANEPLAFEPLAFANYRRVGSICLLGSANLSNGFLHAVVNLDNPVGIAFYRTQVKRHMAMARRYQRYALSNEYRDNANDEFVDRAFVQEGSDEVPTAHHPNVLALLLFQAHCEGTDGPIDEFNTSRHGCWRRLSRKYVVAIELRAHTQAQIVCLPAQQLRVDGLHESSHSVEPLGSGAARKPVDVVVWPSDVPVGAGRNVDDDPPALACAGCHCNLLKSELSARWRPLSYRLDAVGEFPKQRTYTVCPTAFKELTHLKLNSPI